MLRCLDAHSGIHVVHQILEPEPPENSALYRRLRRHERKSISATAHRIQAANVANRATLLLKNATWTHPWKFNGFVLVRNPLSIINSLKVAHDTKSHQSRRQLHIDRWAKQIAPSLLDEFGDKSSVEKVALLYEAKMLTLATCGLPIVRYEDFVQYPEMIMKKLLAVLKIPWDDSVLRSHERYSEGQLGHGKIPLWKPIHDGSLDSWRNLPTKAIDTILRINAKSMEAFGYELHDGNMVLRKGVPNLITNDEKRTFFQKLMLIARRHS